MASIQLETHVSANTLLNAIERMSPRDLARLRKRVLMLSAQKRVLALPQKEARLLTKINRPFMQQDRYNELIAKRQHEKLTPSEYAGLIQLTQQNEEFMVERVRSLTQLARLRGVPLDVLMKRLGIVQPSYAD